MPALIPQSNQAGFVYVAWGEKFIKEAISSAKVVKAHMNLPIAIIVPEPIAGEHPFDQVLICPFTRTYRDKILMKYSPYEHTVFLDTDTFMLGSFEQVFALLDRFDVAFQFSAPSNHYSLPGVPGLAFYEPSAGLFAWRANELTKHFFEIWDDEYTLQEVANGNGAWDQRSMRAALWRSDVRLTSLGTDWQMYSFEFSILMNSAKLVHGRGRDAETAIATCNKFIGPRLYAPRLGVTSAWSVGPLDYLGLAFRSIGLAIHRSARLALHYTGLWRLPANTRPA